MHRVSLAKEEEYEHENRAHMDMTAKKFMGNKTSLSSMIMKKSQSKMTSEFYIMYDLVDTDLEMLRNELLLAGSYFIKRQVPMLNSEDIENMNPLIDRISTLEMLLLYKYSPSTPRWGIYFFDFLKKNYLKSISPPLLYYKKLIYRIS